MAQKQTGGNGKRNQEAIDYANQNGFEISFTKKQHIQFRGHGGIVIASGSPRSPDNVKRVIGQLKKLVAASRGGEK